MSQKNQGPEPEFQWLEDGIVQLAIWAKDGAYAMFVLLRNVGFAIMGIDPDQSED